MNTGTNVVAFVAIAYGVAIGGILAYAFSIALRIREARRRLDDLSRPE